MTKRATIIEITARRLHSRKIEASDENISDYMPMDADSARYIERLNVAQWTRLKNAIRKHVAHVAAIEASNTRIRAALAARG